MFAYCLNNPVIAADPTGEWLNIVIGTIVGTVVNTVTAIMEQKPIDEVIVSGICGAVSGGLTAAGFGVIAGAVTSFVDSAYGNAKDVISGKKSIGEAIVGTTIDTTLGTAFGAIGSGSATEIAQSKQISSAGWRGMKTLLSKSVHPAVKATAKKAVKSASIYAWRTFGKEMLSGIVATGITKGTNWYALEVYKNCAAAN